MAKRQFLTLPEAVIRIRLQSSQKCPESAVITPMVPCALAILYSRAGPDSSPMEKVYVILSGNLTIRVGDKEEKHAIHRAQEKLNKSNYKVVMRKNFINQCKKIGVKRRLPEYLFSIFSTALDDLQGMFIIFTGINDGVGKIWVIFYFKKIINPDRKGEQKNYKQPVSFF